MVNFTKLFCAFFGSVDGGYLFYAFFYNGKNPARYVVFMVACGLLLGGWMGLEAGREIIKDSRSVWWPQGKDQGRESQESKAARMQRMVDYYRAQEAQGGN